MIREAITKLTNFEDITFMEASEAMTEIMSGQASPAQLSAFLIALRMKGETIDEISGCAQVMREKAAKVELGSDNAIDIVGTGGDGANTINISTCSAFVVAAAGVPVAKHGNRSVSSRCGSADVLEALGVNINLLPAEAVECFQKTGLCFMFAPTYHTSMKYAAGPRKELGLRTIFNILGPLANPARVRNQLLGVCDEKLVEPLTRTLANLGVKNAMTVSSQDGLDEISISAPTTVCELRDGRLTGYIIHPYQFGIKQCSLKEIRGGDAEENAEIMKGVLTGTLSGPKRDVILLNSGAALYVAGKAQTIKEGLRLATLAIDAGSAWQKLEDYRKCSHSLKEMTV